MESSYGYMSLSYLIFECKWIYWADQVKAMCVYQLCPGQGEIEHHTCKPETEREKEAGQLMWYKPEMEDYQ